jgi:anti-sigma28 factor (negative regulator of flagellin synthesis)
MRIDKVNAPQSPAPAARAARTAAADPDTPVQQLRPAARVSLSDAGRALAEQAGTESTDGRPPLTPERIAEIRARIASGAYDDPEVMRSVAARILGSGDLEESHPSAE